jgi:hypothetical protein
VRSLRRAQPFNLEEVTVEQTLRQGMRFPPDDGAVAWIDPAVYEDRRDFKPLFAALIVNEVLAGCGLLLLLRLVLQ